MKKLIMVGTVLALTLTMGTTAFACRRAPAAKKTVQTTTANTVCPFVDANYDGICDNGDAHCFYFVDADGNGVCDTCQNKNTHNSGSHGHSSANGGYGHHGGSHH